MDAKVVVIVAILNPGSSFQLCSSLLGRVESLQMAMFQSHTSCKPSVLFGWWNCHKEQCFQLNLGFECQMHSDCSFKIIDWISR